MPDLQHGIQGGVVEHLQPGDFDTYTVLAGQSVTGGQLVEAAAGRKVVRAAQAGSRKVLGIALHNAAAGEKVSVLSTGVVRLTASGAITAGDLVKAGAAGVAVSAADDVGLEQAVIAGGAAGAHVVTGIKTTDRLVAVLEFATAAAIATLTDLTSEFTISDADEIDNTGGTATTNDALLVLWESSDEGGVVGIALEDIATTETGLVKLRGF